MLKIINTLKPFFEDNYRRINVREYARMINVTPPTASKLLESYRKEGLLKKEEEKQYFYYFANKESSLFIDLMRIYWKFKFENVGLIKFFEEIYLNPLIILFGSLSKAESKLDSDIDMAVFASTKKNIKLERFEKKLDRGIHLFVFRGKGDVKSTELLNNILNGYVIRGHW